ncbi:MAG TPA: class I SAM-dependent methyltransferase [Gaiellaceae bacterium]
MGRFSRPLAAEFAAFAAIGPDAHVLDVGAGTGALTSELARSWRVVAAEPSPPFADALRATNPATEVHVAPAEALPFADGAFDAALAQLVVHFMDDPVAGLREMARVTRSGGVVAACVWDYGGRRAPLSPFWNVLAELDPTAENESHLAGARDGHLVELLRAAGVRDPEQGELTVDVEYSSFEEWWEPYTQGVGPAGAYVARLGDGDRARLRDACRAALPEAPFVVHGTAWAARGTVQP